MNRKKEGEVKRVTKSRQNMERGPGSKGLLFLLTVNQERRR
jgi:hypothetical protein